MLIHQVGLVVHVVATYDSCYTHIYSQLPMLPMLPRIRCLNLWHVLFHIFTQMLILAPTLPSTSTLHACPPTPSRNGLAVPLATARDPTPPLGRWGTNYTWMVLLCCLPIPLHIFCAAKQNHSSHKNIELLIKIIAALSISNPPDLPRQGW